MKHRRLCSHDMAVVPADGYVLADQGGEMYFCNQRCLCLWAVAFVTKPERTEQEKGMAVEMTTPSGAKRRFSHLLDLAQWAAANALGGAKNKWIKNGEDLI